MRTGRAVVAGVVGTAVMTALLLIEPSVGLPKIAMGQVVSTSLGLASASLAIGPALGWVIHFLVGILLAIVYAAFFISRLPGSALVRGLIYGMLVFLVAQVVFMPLAGIGFFSRGDFELIAGSLLGHFVYGGLTAWIYGEPATAG
jgi:uncharacterized membrane protein YagU involved in acid resistance